MDRKPFGECRGEVATKRYSFLSRGVARPWCINVSRIFLAMAVRAETYARGLVTVAHAQDKLNALELFSLKK
jgi:hypothetical protein